MTATMDNTQTAPQPDAGTSPARPGSPSTSTGVARRIDSPVLPDPERLEALAEELDRLRSEVLDSLGAEDADYIRTLVRRQRLLELAGRLTLLAGALPPVWLAGTAMLATSKILENMEIGHNVLHGQWDWMRDPDLRSTTWEWDNVCPASQWRHSHNEVHHVWTNVAGRDRDLGYGILRVGDHQRWTPAVRLQPLYAALLAVLFEWGVAVHDVDLDRLAGEDRPGDDWDPGYERTRTAARARLAEVARKASRQVLKDYVVFPLLAGPAFLPVLTGNLVANLTRNVWAFTIIFCGHFPDGAEQFDPADVEGETRGGWYARQVLGSANISGGPVLDLMSGNLSYQIEHHLFPDLPSNRYARLAPAVRAACERAGLPYTTGSLPRQVASFVGRIVRFARRP